MEGAKRPQASVSERAGVIMKMKARILLEALTVAWPKLSPGCEKRVDLRKLPPELRTLAENAHSRDELLERFGKSML